MPPISLGSEPIAIITIADLALQAVQQAALNVSSGIHLAIAVVLIVLNAVLARATVTPVKKAIAPPPPPAPPAATPPAA
jgi:galactitol-specific phosphotransferase system IIC component